VTHNDLLTPVLSGPDMSPVRTRLTAGVVTNIVLLTMIAPLATDMYVPGFPAVSRDLHASATGVQLTLTTYFVGMALGQLGLDVLLLPCGSSIDSPPCVLARP
jgi:MFS family permease